MSSRWIRAAVACSALTLSSLALAQTWPARAVKVIVPFGPGGSADTLGRLASTKLTEALGQSFVVENRGGAGGMVGSELVAKSAPDGYTLVVSGIASHAIGPAMLDKPPFDPVRDFTHIALFGGPPLVLAVNPNVPAKTLKEFIDYANKLGKPITFASSGVGSDGHLMGEAIALATKIKVEHVPYRSTSQALTDVVAGHVAFSTLTLSSTAQFLRAGTITGIAVTSPERMPDNPEIPTFKELGYPELVGTTWFSLSGPAKLPADIVQKLNAELNEALKVAQVREVLAKQGLDAVGGPPERFGQLIAREIPRWKRVVAAAGIKPE